MTQNPENQPQGDAQKQAGQEQYTFQDTKSDQGFSTRTANRQAWFLLPHLRPGMRLLDCGCGAGSITVGLAAVVAPGDVIGIDIQPSQVELASRLAVEKGTANIRFQVGNIYELPFPDASFDAVFANALVQHLADPLKAIEEMHRVLRPGGVIGVRDADQYTRAWTPSSPLLEEFRKLALRIMEHNGARLDYPRQQRRFLIEAGFVHSEAFADAESRGTLDDTRDMADQAIDNFRGKNVARVILEQDLAGEAKLDTIAKELREWGERPDSFWAVLWCSAVGWKAE